MEEDRKRGREWELEVRRSRAHTKRGGGEGLRMRKTGVGQEKKTKENGVDLTLGLYKRDFLKIKIGIPKFKWYAILFELT